tara:strand:- start:2989 stop:3465 length:477 start_codon:yes stop_codon:yes gene_type:complete
MFSGNQGGCYSMDKDGTMKEMSEGDFKTEKDISTIKKDLRTFLTGFQKQPKIYLNETMPIWNPALKDKVNTELINCWAHMAGAEVLMDLTGKRKKRIDGKDWNVGFLGSVWKDVELAGVYTRICYYSKKCNGNQLKKIPKEYKYLLMLDPHSVDSFQV